MLPCAPRISITAVRVPLGILHNVTHHFMWPGNCLKQKIRAGSGWEVGWVGRGGEGSGGGGLGQGQEGS